MCICLKWRLASLLLENLSSHLFLNCLKSSVDCRPSICSPHFPNILPPPQNS